MLQVDAARTHTQVQSPYTEQLAEVELVYLEKTKPVFHSQSTTKRRAVHKQRTMTMTARPGTANMEAFSPPPGMKEG